MRRFSVWHALYLSFFSRELYQDVGRNWRGMGFTYLALLLALAWLPSFVQMHIAFQFLASDAIPQALNDFPSITIHNGVVETDPPGPHVFHDPESGKPFLIIDTSVDQPELDQMQDAAAFLTRSKLALREDRRGQTRIYDLSGVQDFSLTRDDILRWARWVASWAAVVLAPLLLIFSLGYRMAQAFIYGGIGLAFAKGAQPPVKYETLVRLAAVAVTPAVVLDTARDLASIPIPWWWLICFLLAMGYLHFAVRAVKEAPPAEPVASAAPPPIA